MRKTQFIIARGRCRMCKAGHKGVTLTISTRTKERAGTMPALSLLGMIGNYPAISKMRLPQLAIWSPYVHFTLIV